MLLLLLSMFWDCGSYKTSWVRLLGKVKGNWMPVLVSPSCKALTKDTGRWVSSEAGHWGRKLDQCSLKWCPFTSPVGPGQTTDAWALTWTSNQILQGRGQAPVFPPGFPGEVCDQTWSHQERGAPCPGKVPSCLEPGSCQGWRVCAAVGRVQFPGGGAGSSVTLQIETGGWAWGSAYNSDSLEVLKINKALGVWGGLVGWGGPAGLWGGTIAEAPNPASLTFSSVLCMGGGSVAWPGSRLGRVALAGSLEGLMIPWNQGYVFCLASRAPPSLPFPASLSLVPSQCFPCSDQSGFLLLSLKIHCLEIKPRALESDIGRWWTRKLHILLLPWKH